jgi:carbamoyl-phosphate synthase small subunit
MAEIYLNLSDGTSWSGKCDNFTSEPKEGEVVFTTANSGYPQAISDPSFAGQIIVFAFPPVGIYGVDTSNLEGLRPWAEAVIVNHIEETPEKTATQLSEWLKSWGIPLVHGIDTRNLILKFREHGTLMGRLSHKCEKPSIQMSSVSLVDKVSTPVTEIFGSGKKTIGILDLGVKRNIIREMESRNYRVINFPHSTNSQKLLSSDLDGLILSNGPGNPADLKEQVEKIKELLGKLPMFGICLGTQLLSLACGAKTTKLPYGHRGANHPVLEAQSGKTFVTSQNHGYAIVEDSLSGTGLDVTFRHLSDNTVEGICHREISAFGVQFHPEANPGPWDAKILFDRLLGFLGAFERTGS